jgi:hypothetical protein
MSIAIQLNQEWLELAGKLELQKKATQDFFASYAAEIRSPAYGDGAKVFAESMLTRATEAGLYAKPAESK